MSAVSLNELFHIRPAEVRRSPRSKVELITVSFECYYSTGLSQDSSMREENRRKGFTLVLTGACIVSLFGMLGLSVDLGRVYITKSETQSFADTGALAGAPALNGTSFVSAR